MFSCILLNVQLFLVRELISTAGAKTTLDWVGNTLKRIQRIASSLNLTFTGSKQFNH